MTKDTRTDRELIADIQAGDNRAADIFITRNIGLVYHVLIARSVPQTDENINSGRIGLWLGAKRFDLSRDIAISTYITYWIRSALQKANRLLINEKRIMENSSSYSSLDYTMLTLQVNKRHDIETIDMQDFIQSLELSKKQQKMLNLRMAGYTLTEIGKIYGLSGERVRQYIEDITFNEKVMISLKSHLSNNYYRARIHNVVRLKERGLTIEEIAKNMDLTEKEVAKDINMAYVYSKVYIKRKRIIEKKMMPVKQQQMKFVWGE